ncbi:MAG: DUF1801 domain-containing protein [Saprospiraceae bacterium]|nr:DUF1801 domain-containing protein [Saprospiraceae bacterium]
MTSSDLVQIKQYNYNLSEPFISISETLAALLTEHLSEATTKIWHGHPVWFIEGNPIAGYSQQKQGIRLMFWSGADFEEESLSVKGKKFKDASVFFNEVGEINEDEIIRWIEKSKVIQWDYKNLIKRKGILERLK